MMSKYFKALALAGLAIAPIQVGATEIITAIAANPGARSAQISFNGHFSNLSVAAGRFQLGGSSQPSGAAVSYLTYCIDVLHTFSTGAFEIRPLSQVLSDPVRRARLTALITAVDPLIVGTSDTARNISAAIQVAAWEIINETSGTYSLAAGAFRVSGLSNATRDLASGYLTQVVNGGLVATPGRELRVLYNANNQSQAFVASAVPEPATWSMMLAGFAAVGYSLRRRRTIATVVRGAKA